MKAILFHSPHPCSHRRQPKSPRRSSTPSAGRWHRGPKRRQRATRRWCPGHRNSSRSRLRQWEGLPPAQPHRTGQGAWRRALPRSGGAFGRVMFISTIWLSCTSWRSNALGRHDAPRRKRRDEPWRTGPISQPTGGGGRTESLSLMEMYTPGAAAPA